MGYESNDFFVDVKVPPISFYIRFSVWDSDWDICCRLYDVDLIWKL